MLIYTDLTNSPWNICRARTHWDMYMCVTYAVCRWGWSIRVVKLMLHFPRLVDGWPICCCWSWIWSSAWPCAWGWPSSIDGSLSRRYRKCVFGSCFASSFWTSLSSLAADFGAAVSLSGTVQLTLLIAAMAVTYSDRPENDSVFYFHIWFTRAL